MNTKLDARRIFGATAGLLLALTATSAHAIPLTWNLLDVEFDDGGVAVGSFDFDADTDLFSNINIQTSGGTASPHFYSLVTIFAGANFPDFIDSLPVVPGITANLSLALVASMTNAGGTIAIQAPGSAGISQESICADTDCNNITLVRDIISGSVTTEVSGIPTPGVLPLLCIGLAGLAWARCRKSVRWHIESHESGSDPNLS